MKTVIALLVLSFSFCAFATSLEEAIRNIESQRGAQCSRLSRSTSLCTGSINGVPATCFYSIKFACASRDGGFGLKAKMKDSWSLRENGYVTKVRKVIVLD